MIGNFVVCNGMRFFVDMFSVNNGIQECFEVCGCKRRSPDTGLRRECRARMQTGTRFGKTAVLFEQRLDVGKRFVNEIVFTALSEEFGGHALFKAIGGAVGHDRIFSDHAFNDFDGNFKRHRFAVFGYDEFIIHRFLFLIGCDGRRVHFDILFVCVGEFAHRLPEHRFFNEVDCSVYGVIDRSCRSRRARRGIDDPFRNAEIFSRGNSVVADVELFKEIAACFVVFGNGRRIEYDFSDPRQCGVFHFDYDVHGYRTVAECAGTRRLNEVIAVAHQIRRVYFAVGIRFVFVGNFQRLFDGSISAVDLFNDSFELFLIGNVKQVVKNCEERAGNDHDREENDQTLKRRALEKFFYFHTRSSFAGFSASGFFSFFFR